ncbi:MAG TPA: hypothetical protein VHM92_04060 [Allosphingosinicella sp.]|nr:hypothetical protein [Allosphingosinicella sp.]
MRLSEFIREALTDIAYGVHEAKVDSQELMAIVPGNLNGETQIEKSYIEFDIAVTAVDTRTASRSGKRGGEAGISVLSLKAAISRERSLADAASSSDEVVSRLSFKIPVFFNAHLRGDQGSAQERAFVKALVARRTDSTAEPERT